MFFFFKQKTAYEMVGSDWSSDVCSSDLISLRQRYRSDDVVWFISAETLEYIARLFRGNLCASTIASKALRESKRHLANSLVLLRSITGLSQSGLKQSNGLTVISFKSQLQELGVEGIPRRSL